MTRSSRLLLVLALAGCSTPSFRDQRDAASEEPDQDADAGTPPPAPPPDAAVDARQPEPVQPPPPPVTGKTVPCIVGQSKLGTCTL